MTRSGDSDTMVQLVPFDSDSSYLYDALRVYTLVWDRDYDDSLLFFRKYTQLPEFYGYVALERNHVVGFAFGTLSAPGQWWHDKVAAQVGRKNPALRDAWVLTELAVLEEYRGQQIGGRLHDAVIAAQPLPKLLLSTQVDNKGAQRFYQRRGWHYLHTGFAFNKGRQPYVIMHRRKRISEHEEHER